MFDSPATKQALEKTIAQHLIRTGDFRTAEIFSKVILVIVCLILWLTGSVGIWNCCSSWRLPTIQCTSPHIRISSKWWYWSCNWVCLIASVLAWCSSFISWVTTNKSILDSRASPLEFYLHRSQYLRILTIPNDSTHEHPAIAYFRQYLLPLYVRYPEEIRRLIACSLWAGSEKPLSESPYSDLASPEIHSCLEEEFNKAFCSEIRVSRHAPLKVVSNIGGGVALPRIEKGKKIMKERKGDWSQTDEIPVCTTRNITTLFLTLCDCRSKSHYPQQIIITLFLPVLYQRNRRLRRIHPWCYSVVMLSYEIAWLSLPSLKRKSVFQSNFLFSYLFQSCQVPVLPKGKHSRGMFTGGILNK